MIINLSISYVEEKMTRFLYFFIIIFSFFNENLFSALPIPTDTSEYLKRCQKFAVPWSFLTDFNELPPPSVLAECGVDPSKVIVINTESILKGAFLPDKPDRVSYFQGLINSKKDLEEAFRTFLYSFALTIQEEGENDLDFQVRSEKYRQFVIKTVSDGLESKKYRERIVSFLAAVEYHKSINSELKVYLIRGEEIGEAYYNNCVYLILEHKNGKHCKDSTPNTCCFFTLPYFATEEKQIFDNGLTKTDAYYNDTECYFHEIGHATRDLLGLNSIGMSFNLITDNLFVRNTFFSVLDVLKESSMPSLISKVRLLINQKIKSGEYATALDYVMKKIKQVKEYKEDRFPSNTEEWGIAAIEAKLEAEDVKKALKRNLVDDDFLRQLATLGIKFMAFYNWDVLDDLFQIEGVMSANNHIIVDRNSDLDLLREQEKPIRWLHIRGDTTKTDESSTFNFVPERKYIEVLFYLHGLKNPFE